MVWAREQYNKLYWWGISRTGKQLFLSRGRMLACKRSKAGGWARLAEPATTGGWPATPAKLVWNLSWVSSWTSPGLGMVLVCTSMVLSVLELLVLSLFLCLQSRLDFFIDSLRKLILVCVVESSLDQRLAEGSIKDAVIIHGRKFLGWHIRLGWDVVILFFPFWSYKMEMPKFFFECQKNCHKSHNYHQLHQSPFQGAFFYKMHTYHEYQCSHQMILLSVPHFLLEMPQCLPQLTQKHLNF